MNRQTLREGGRFALIGGFAFGVGAGLMAVLTNNGISPYVAQFPVLGICVLVTWIGNRLWTFRPVAVPSAHEFLRYLLASAGGLIVNALCFSLCVYLGFVPVTAFAVGTVAAMTFNFTSYKYYVFNERGT